MDIHIRLPFIFHFCAFATNASGLIYDLLYVGEKSENPDAYIYLFDYKGYGGKFKFLTFMCQVSV